MTISLVVSLALVLGACDQVTKGISAGSGEQVALQSGEGLPPNGLVLPVGTAITEHMDEAGKPFIRFILPDSHRLIGFHESELRGEREIVVASRGEVTCNCTEEDEEGCSPIHASGGGKEIIGCIFGGCTRCVGTVTTPGEGRPLMDVDVIPADHTISIVMSQEEADALECPTAALFEVDFVQEALGRFANRMQRTNVDAARAAQNVGELPEGYEMVPIDLFGRLVQVPIESSMAHVTLFVRELVMAEENVRVGGATPTGDGRASCRCNSGPDGCDYESQSIPFIGMAEWCEAGPCMSCTLITS